MAVAFAGLTASAQEVTWGVKAGANISNFKAKEGGFSSTNDSKVGFHVGAFLDWGLSQSFYIQPGLYFSQQGSKNDAGGVDVKMNASYLKLPILASYRINLSGENIRLHINAGPYVAYGLGGKIDDGTSKVDTFGDDGLKRFDAGLSVGLGVNFNKFYVGGGYDFGLANIVDKDYFGGNDAKMKSQNWNITVGFTF